MVQLSPSPYRRLSAEKSMKVVGQQEGSPSALKALPVVLSTASTPYQAYETYIENGLICLKHKIRNIEKKKIKLEDYRDRMAGGEALNPDQLEAVEKYDEIIHNLEFAKELQKTFAALSQELLKAQRKILRRDTIMKLEAEKKKLCTVFQVRYILENICQAHVQKDFRGGFNGAMYLTSKELDYLINFSKLTCPKRDGSLSLEDQMEQSSLYFWDLLEGSERAVAGTTYKNLKDLLARVLDCGYFENIPAHNQEKADVEEDLLKKPDTPLKTQPVKTPEAPVKCMQSNDIHPCEFLNRRYLSEADYITKDFEKSKPWESEHIGKLQSSQSWDVHDTKEQEPKQPQPRPQTPNLPKQGGATNLIPKEQPWEICIERKLQLPLQVRAPLQGQQPPLQGQQAPQPPGAVTLMPNEAPRQRAELLPKERRPRQQKLEPEVSHPAKVMHQPAKVMHQPEKITHQSPKVVNQPATEFCSNSSFPNDPVLRRQELQDLMTKIQGTYNFMQESMLDFEPLSQSAITSSQQDLASPPGLKEEEEEEEEEEEQEQSSECDSSRHPEQVCLATINGSNAVLAITEETVCESENSLSSTLEDVEASLSLPEETENYDPASMDMSEMETKNERNSRASVPLPSEPQQLTSGTPSSPSMSPVSKGQVFQSPPASSNSESITAAPFQAMQTVFKVNAPLPPRKELEMKDEAPYPTSYNQTFTTTSTQTAPQSALQAAQIVDQTSFSQESLSAIPYQPEGTIHMNNGNVTFYPAQVNGFARNAQPYVNCRGSIRGAARGGRALTNSYRSPSGYKGFDGYRVGTPLATNGNYSQPQHLGREYPGVQYTQRDGSYQQSYKRGTSGGLRGNSRGWSDSSQVSSPERDHETYHSGDCGHGDNRSSAPIDMPVTSQAATILPVHVYPLPQQMRVAFSAARTSNFAPGSLDQPIVFDLLLNNLGETFDIHVGRFACPVNGTYVFIFHMLKLAVNVPLYVNLMKNEEVLVSAYANDGAPDHETASNHAVLQLFQGDQIWLRLHRGAIYGSSWKYSTFSGYLLYQD